MRIFVEEFSRIKGFKVRLYLFECYMNVGREIIISMKYYCQLLFIGYF